MFIKYRIWIGVIVCLIVAVGVTFAWAQSKDNSELVTDGVCNIDSRDDADCGGETVSADIDTEPILNQPLDELVNQPTELEEPESENLIITQEETIEVDSPTPKSVLPEPVVEPEPIKQVDSMIVFYGDGCPHCVKVEHYIETNNLMNLFEIDLKEVYYSSTNAQELVDVATLCGIPQNQIGVPFLWTGSDCLIGDTDIINYFESL